ncbi:MAG: leucyl aminopeptidase [Gammaproteobacteria bacterium]|nr:leucyl aminopeptidase [Gammaproteobacteria bacterium]
MEFEAKSGIPSNQRTACLILGVFEKRKLPAVSRSVDQACNGQLRQLLKSGDMDGKLGHSLMLYNPQELPCKRILLIGCGAEKDFNLAAYRKVVGKAVSTLKKGGTTEAVTCLPYLMPKESTTYSIFRDTVVAAEEAMYSFNQCKSSTDSSKRPLRKLSLMLEDRSELKKAVKGIDHGMAIANGVSRAKDLGNLPGNICTPSYLADQAKTMKRRSRKLKVEILEEAQMKRLGMGSLLSVSSGSRQPAKLIVMEYRGGKPKSKPVVLVGKGLTFDAGGISLKSSAGMEEMKYDMCGGASVLGVMSACLDLKLPINLIGLVPTSENLPDGAANKPGDIVTSMSGKTIEILNTDAEGRLILCDALTYAERFNPAAVIDIATLTGACVVALGKHASGLLANNDTLARELLDAGVETGDRAWQLPLWDDYQEMIDSKTADMANIGGRWAGTITAACFLSRFTKDYKWAHLDIAGSAWSSGSTKSATGRPVPLLTQLLLKRCRLDG